MVAGWRRPPCTICDLVIPNPTCLPPVSAGEETSPLRFAGLGIGVIRLGFGIRVQLAQADDTVLAQKQRPTRTPTFRWILQKFQAIHLVSIGSSQQASNLSEERRKIICLMGFLACQYYLLK